MGEVLLILPFLTSIPCGSRSRRTSLAARNKGSYNQTLGAQRLIRSNYKRKRERVFFLDVNPICYTGTSPSLPSFCYWMSLFFTQVSHTDPVIAVFDGEGGNEYRRELLPSYKAHRTMLSRQCTTPPPFSRVKDKSLHHLVTSILLKCNVPVKTFLSGSLIILVVIQCGIPMRYPSFRFSREHYVVFALKVVKIEGHEADDVIATLSERALGSGLRVVIGSPDKDFKQLISEDLQIVMPMPELGRWSFYTLKHYIDQYACDPSSDLSLRCILGDDVDGVPGIQHVAPGFGRKTALRLLEKHGSLENLLNASKVRTVGKQYVQEALTKHADYLRKNYEVLSLRKDVDVHLEKKWLQKRDACNDEITLSNFAANLGEPLEFNHQKRVWCR